ncbi:SurA N-terminal domain-containing protein [Accumulibacter sp.]|uniref:SurA N-terminal domain-containing protein n=1 Tax=Accumulibacter sp. TaxID=2053492 RepID=UPI0025D0F19B|nr:SurA N-terminal domain-containing protein [Accumulibacter sp.]MCM8594838.1 SurA N-terminal domain-containing protein [Accumulibacter sp.]MCM8625660.1 SurA N-terminal domain-containing protein [Accumulibacter sp.]MDS4048984.1 SurA N-terminal domain-containing protein [Accumulibacter sp.]
MFFDTVRNNKRAVQIFLALITLPFAFWGIDSYVRNAGAGTDLASVGDTKITVQQYELAWRAQQDRMRQALGASFSPEMMKTPAARAAVLNSLIDQRVLLLEAAKGRLGASDSLLREVIGKIPALQEDGQFSMDRYKAALTAQGMSQAQFEAQLRQDLTLQQIVAAIGETAIGSQAVTEALQRIQSEERQVAEWRIAPEQFAAQVKIDEQTARKFYDENPERFTIAEQARVEYLVLSLDALLARIKPAETEVRAWYESHQDRYRQPEERRASHILIAANGEADPAKARAKAEEILGEVRKSPARFAEFARQYSQDTGSAEKGGDLGFFARGMMVRPFEEAVFKLRENEISPLVQSDFGYHIIRLTEIKPGKQRSLAEVRPEIEDELRRQTASRQFAEAAESFSNVVYEQPDSLQPAAEKFDLKLQQSGWLPKNPSADALRALGQLGDARLLNSVFSEDSLKNRRNTEVVEIAPNTLIAARVVEHRPASVRSFESVREDIVKGLKLREEAALARTTGEAKLAELRQGAADTLPWTQPRKVSRQDPRQVSPAALKAIFGAETNKLPAYAGAEAGGGSYALYKIVGVSHPATADEKQRRALQRQYDTILGQEDFSAYLASLRQRYRIDVNKALLESKER